MYKYFDLIVLIYLYFELGPLLLILKCARLLNMVYVRCLILCCREMLGLDRSLCCFAILGLLATCIRRVRARVPGWHT